MKQLVCKNAGGGLKPNPRPAAHLNDDGALVLNVSADAMISGVKWIVHYEENPDRTPAIELRAASASDTAAYKVSRSGGSVAKVTLRSLWNEIKHADKFVGRYTISRMAHGLRLTRTGDYQ